MLGIMDFTREDTTDTAEIEEKLKVELKNEAKTLFKEAKITQFFKSPPKTDQKPQNLLEYFQKNSIKRKSDNACKLPFEEKKYSSKPPPVAKGDGHAVSEISKNEEFLIATKDSISEKSLSKQEGGENMKKVKKDAVVKSSKTDCDDRPVKKKSHKRKDCSGKDLNEDKVNSKDSSRKALSKRKKDEALNSSSEDFEESVSSKKLKKSSPQNKDKEKERGKKSQITALQDEHEARIEIHETCDSTGAKSVEASDQNKVDGPVKTDSGRAECENIAVIKTDAALKRDSVLEYAATTKKNECVTSGAGNKPESELNRSELPMKLVPVISFEDFIREQNEKISDEEDEVLLLSSEEEDQDEHKSMGKTGADLKGAHGSMAANSPVVDTDCDHLKKNTKSDSSNFSDEKRVSSCETYLYTEVKNELNIFEKDHKSTSIEASVYSTETKIVAQTSSPNIQTKENLDDLNSDMKVVTVEAQIHIPSVNSEGVGASRDNEVTSPSRQSNVAVKGEDHNLSIIEVIAPPPVKPLYSIFLKKPKKEKKMDVTDSNGKDNTANDALPDDALPDGQQKESVPNDEMNELPKKRVTDSKKAKQNRQKEKSGKPPTETASQKGKRKRKKVIADDENVDGDVASPTTEADTIRLGPKTAPDSAAAAGQTSSRRVLRARKPTKRLVVSSDEESDEERRPIKQRKSGSAGIKRGTSTNVKEKDKLAKEKTAAQIASADDKNAEDKDCVVFIKATSPNKRLEKRLNNPSASKAKAKVKLAPMFTKEGRKAIAKRQDEIIKVETIDLSEEIKLEESSQQDVWPSGFEPLTFTKKPEKKMEHPERLPFPKVIHIQQINAEIQESLAGLSSALALVKFPWRLERKLHLEDVMKGCFSPGLFTFSQVPGARFSAYVFQKFPELTLEIQRAALEEFAKTNSRFPVRRVFKRFLAMKQGKAEKPGIKDPKLKQPEEGRISFNTTEKMSKDESSEEACKIRRRSLRRKSSRGGDKEEGKQKSKEEGHNTAQESKEPTDFLWTDKYQPTCSTDLLGNTIAVKKFTSWLAEWKTKVQRLKKKEAKASKKSNVSKADSESDFEMSDEDFSSGSDEEDDRLCNTMVITGPHGVGKTSLVYACAKELGFKVLEVNASSKRVGKQILMDLGEATQSHRVAEHANTNTLTKFLTGKNMPGRLKSPPKPPPKPKKLPKAFAAFYKVNETKNDGNSKPQTLKKLPGVPQGAKPKTPKGKVIKETSTLRKKSLSKVSPGKKSKVTNVSTLSGKNAKQTLAKGMKSQVEKLLKTPQRERPAENRKGFAGSGTKKTPTRNNRRSPAVKEMGKGTSNRGLTNENSGVGKKASKTTPKSGLVKSSIASKSKTPTAIGSSASKPKTLKKASSDGTKLETSYETTKKLSSYSLILFDEADIVFEEDKGFLSALSTFMSSAKRPVIITTSDKHFQNTLDGKYELLSLKKPDSSRVATSLQLMCLAENVVTSYYDMKGVADFFDADIRQCINNVQFWVNSGAMMDPSVKQTLSNSFSANTEEKSRQEKVKMPENVSPEVIDLTSPNLSSDVCDNNDGGATNYKRGSARVHQGCLEAVLGLESLCGYHGDKSSVFQCKQVTSMDKHILSSFQEILFSRCKALSDSFERKRFNIELCSILRCDSCNSDRITTARAGTQKALDAKLLESISNYTETLCDLDVCSRGNSLCDRETFSQHGWWYSNTFPSLEEEGVSFIPENFINKQRNLQWHGFVTSANLNVLSSQVQRLSAQFQGVLSNIAKPGKNDVSDFCCENLDASRHSTEISDLYELMSRKLPRMVRCDHRAITTDYIPTLRLICKSEKMREEAKIKRRFLHYLDLISLNVRPSDQISLASITDHLSHRSVPPQETPARDEIERDDSFLTC